MNTRKLSVAMAAMLLGMQLGSPAVAAISERDIALVEAYVNAGQVDALLALLAANPDLLSLSGFLGDALRAFAANPSAATMAGVAQVAGGPIAVALKAAIVRDPGTAIY